MIYSKNNPVPNQHSRYQASFEYMLVLSKGKPKTFNPILENVKYFGARSTSVGRNVDGTHRYSTRGLSKTKYRKNIWDYTVGGGHSASDKIAFQHPAIFPEKLAEDHITSWSNPGDLILDPFNGSGTTCKMAKINKRRYIGIDISEEYCELARERCNNV